MTTAPRVSRLPSDRRLPLELRPAGICCQAADSCESSAALLLLGAVAQTAHHRGLAAESMFGQLIPAFLVVTVGIS